MFELLAPQQASSVLPVELPQTVQDQLQAVVILTEDGYPPPKKFVFVLDAFTAVVMLAEDGFPPPRK